MARAIYIDRFTSLDELRRDERTLPIVLRSIMNNNGRFSVFGASDDQMARILDRIENGGYTTREPSFYPWITVRLTDKGKQVLGIKPEGPPPSGDGPS